MRLYEGSIEQFKQDVITNKIADQMAGNFKNYYRRTCNPSEKNSWINSLNFVKNALDYSNLKDNQIVVEYELPYSQRRIDLILFGKDNENTDNVILIELKQWSNENVYDCETEGNVIVDFGRFKKEHVHPSLQVEGYHYDVQDYMKIFEESPKINLSSCVYCHNYSKTGNNVLFYPKFKTEIDKFPLFSKEDVTSLGDYLKNRLNKGSGIEVFGRFVNSPIKASKKLLEHVGEMINKQQVFNLIDEQITAYNKIVHEAKKLSSTNTKSVIIVKGGPGTGKSVIALEVMAELLKQNKTVYHATGSSAFTNTLRKLLGVRASKQFKFFNSFMNQEPNKIDVLICDEAHRIRKTSENMYTPSANRTGEPQIDELIKSAKLSLFFIDEFQIVRPTEIGNIELIKESAKKFGITENNITEFELKTQFRCGGSDSFIQWIDSTLGLRESEDQILRKDQKMEFKIFDDPLEMKKALDEKNKEKKNCARIVAGFCWEWSKPKHDGTLVNDVKVENLEMPWEKKDDFWKWATHDTGMEQVGTVYTAQGFEFDYIGVIFGKDLVYSNKEGKWIAQPKESFDSMAKRGNTNLEQHLKHVYRVLLSRAHKGCYVYFMDKETEKYFKSKIEE